MKKLKKSLLVVPALGVLMLAAAGSVGGTVAWFSSVNTFQTDVSSFAVGRVEGNLDVTMTAVPAKGTITMGSGVAVGKDAAGDVNMTHGSFNHTVGTLGETSVYTISNQAIAEGASTFNVATGGRTGLSVDRAKFLYKSKQIAGTYTFTFDGTNWDLAANGNVAAAADITPEVLANDWGIAYTATTGNPASDKTLIFTLTNTYAADTDWMYNAAKVNGKYWYHAVSWNMTFKYDFGADTTARNVYFDTTSTITRTTSKDGTKSEETWKGFRLAFHNSTTRNVIWAPQQTETAYIHYVSGTSALSNYTYTEDDKVSLLYSGISSGIVANTATSGGTATASTNQNYLCQLTSGTPSVTINCVAWFEGSDPNVINEADLDTVAATLKFFAVQHANA